MNWLRLLVPTWKFFDKVGPVATLFYRTSVNQVWSPCLSKPIRNPTHLFVNAEGNIYLAEQGLVDQLINDINSMDQKLDVSEAIKSYTSYQLVLNMVRYYLKLQKIKQVQFQFKIEVKTNNEAYDAIISNEYGL